MSREAFETGFDPYILFYTKGKEIQRTSRIVVERIDRPEVIQPRQLIERLDEAIDEVIDEGKRLEIIVYMFDMNYLLL